MPENNVGNLNSEQDNDLCTVTGFPLTINTAVKNTRCHQKHVQKGSLITALNREELKYRIISQNRWNPKY